MGWDVAQLGERRIASPLTRVRFPGAAKNFSRRVTFQCGPSYGVRTPPCVTACINNCAHVKDPVVHVRVRWIMETLKHPACTVGWVAPLCRSWLSPGRSKPNFPWEKSTWDNTVVEHVSPEQYFSLKVPRTDFELSQTRTSIRRFPRLPERRRDAAVFLGQYMYFTLKILQTVSEFSRPEPPSEASLDCIRAFPGQYFPLKVPWSALGLFQTATSH